MFLYVYRQRRRILVSGFFFTLSVLMYLTSRYEDLQMADRPDWIVVVAISLTTILCGLIAMAATTIYITLFPNWRHLAEMLSLLLFTMAVLSQFVPGVTDHAYIGAFLPFALIMLIHSVTYGTLLDRFPMWLDYSETRSFRSPKTAEQLWSELVPGAAPVEDHWDKLLFQANTDPEEPDTLNVLYNHGQSLYEHQSMTFLERDAPRYCKYHHLGEVNLKNRELAEGIYEISITPLRGEPECEVAISSHRTALLPRQGLSMWFDDELGDRADHIQAKHIGRRDWSLAGRYRRKAGQLA